MAWFQGDSDFAWDAARDAAEAHAEAARREAANPREKILVVTVFDLTHILWKRQKRRKTNQNSQLQKTSKNLRKRNSKLQRKWRNRKDSNIKWH